MVFSSVTLSADGSCSGSTRRSAYGGLYGNRGKEVAREVIEIWRSETTEKCKVLVQKVAVCRHGEDSVGRKKQHSAQLI